MRSESPFATTWSVVMAPQKKEKKTGSGKAPSGDKGDKKDKPKTTTTAVQSKKTTKKPAASGKRGGGRGCILGNCLVQGELIIKLCRE